MKRELFIELRMFSEIKIECTRVRIDDADADVELGGCHGNFAK